MVDDAQETLFLDKISDALLDSIDKIATQCQDFAVDAIPVALPVFAIAVFVGFGLKFARRLIK